MNSHYSDTEYRGEVNEKGWRWDHDTDCYPDPDRYLALRIDEDEDGKMECHVVYIGSWNVEVTERELDAVTDEDRDETYRRWLTEKPKRGLG